MDYRLTDPYLDPPGLIDANYVEKSIRLPDSFWCYDPVAMKVDSVAVAPLAALANGFVTFGCLNNYCKVNAGVLRLWARVLRAVDRSRLILLAPPGTPRNRAIDLLREEGIEADRVLFVGRQRREHYLETYHRIDIGLDTFPYNGHTTSMDSMWMGVPVVTLVGRTAVGRAGWSQLCNLGLKDLAAQNEEQFVQVAVGLARDLGRLSQLRLELRDRMLASPLTDGRRLAKNIVNAYRQMWEKWCSAR